MADMLVKLYTLPEITPLLAQLGTEGIEIRQAAPAEKRIVANWVRAHFSETWAAECEAGIEQRPVCCYIAVEKSQARPANDSPYSMHPEKLVGFACFNVTTSSMFVPTGGPEASRGL